MECSAGRVPSASPSKITRSNAAYHLMNDDGYQFTPMLNASALPLAPAAASPLSNTASSTSSLL